MKIRPIESTEDKSQCSEIIRLIHGINFDLDYLYTSKYLGLFDDNGQLLSFLGYSPSAMDNKYFEVYAVNTHPDHRKKGYATKLLNYVENLINTYSERDVRILLTCRKEKESFYGKRGYRTLSETKETCIMFFEKDYSDPYG